MEICNSAYKANTCLWSYIFTSTVFYVFTETDICDKKKKKRRGNNTKTQPRFTVFVLAVFSYD